MLPDYVKSVLDSAKQYAKDCRNAHKRITWDDYERFKSELTSHGYYEHEYTKKLVKILHL